jgi:imidazole glycerol-phosphate synthase subunit HisH
MIVIIDYGLGNLKSVAGAVEKLGSVPVISNKLEDIQRAQKLILPGVGAFGDGMRNLSELKLIEPLTRKVKEEKVPILGICLGVQLFAKESFEFGHHQGLGWIDASVVKLEPSDKSLRVPHVGWNELLRKGKSVLFEGIPEDGLFYYVHSFHLKCKSENVVIGECEYGEKFTAAVQSENIYGTQFHPEKSQLHGLNVLKNFLEKA